MRNEIDLSYEDHEIALKEVAFLLEHFSATISELVGKASGTVGMNSGREAARKMPVVFASLEQEQIFAAIAEQLKGGFDIQMHVENDEDLVQKIGRCAIRNACQTASEELGGNICSMFHAYLRGVVTEASGIKLRAGKIEPGEEQCVIRELVF